MSVPTAASSQQSKSTNNFDLGAGSLRSRVALWASTLVSVWVLAGVAGCGGADQLESDLDVGYTEAYSSAVDETTFAFSNWDGTNTISTCIATGVGTCTTAGVEPGAGNPGSNVICEGSSNVADCGNGFSGCTFERIGVSYTPSVDGRVCRIDFQMDSRTVSGTDLASHHLTVTQGATSVFDPAGTFMIDTTYQTRSGSFTLAELDAAGIDRSGSTPLIFGARTADCAPSNPAPITWRMDNLVVTVVKDLDDDGTCDDSQATVCSNGVVEPGEICDDGNTDAGDGCSPACLYVDNLVDGSDCSAIGDLECASGVCDTTETPDSCEAASSCGNNVVEGTEACDDGNVLPGDGCDVACLVEDGTACTSNAECASAVCDASETPPVCEAPNTCGNAMLEGAEVCDDGTRVSGDGCSESCVFENAWRGGGGCAVRAKNKNDGQEWLLSLLSAGLVRWRRHRPMRKV